MLRAGVSKAALLGDNPHEQPPKRLETVSERDRMVQDNEKSTVEKLATDNQRLQLEVERARAAVDQVNATLARDREVLATLMRGLTRAPWCNAWAHVMAQQQQ